MSVYPTEVRASLNDEVKEKAWRFSETLSVPGNGQWIEFPNGVRGAAVELSIITGQGSVESTVESLTNVRNDSASGVVWDQGVVSGTTQDYVIPVTAVRAVNVSGEITINVRFQ
jgi:hypothetical protein